jgi:hypothetical protein
MKEMATASKGIAKVNLSIPCNIFLTVSKYDPKIFSTFSFVLMYCNILLLANLRIIDIIGTKEMNGET